MITPSAYQCAACCGPHSLQQPAACNYAQEREREQAEERRKAQEAALLLQKAAGGYGGGSGPLRGLDGRPITDLNQARREWTSSSSRTAAFC